MGTKTNPIGLRLGIIRGWDSNWYGGRKFESKLVEDNNIRKYLNTRLSKALISKINIERSLKLVTVTIHAARPGIIIGRSGQEIDKLKEELKKLTDKEIQVNINEVRRPELNAVLVAADVARKIEGRIGFRRAVKSSIELTMRNGAEGIKILVSGRLGGAEMARSEMYKEGRIPLHTLRADIDYASTAANTTYGCIGVKVWICKGEVYEKRELVPFEGIAGKRGGARGGDKSERGGEKWGDRRGGDRRGGDRRGGDRNKKRNDNRGNDRRNDNRRNNS